ncbi:arabinose isomerase [Sphingobacterium corticis]|uniref:Arabinose isomerase n=1 Tax=Sphingobacterium corticis TaxID=1812823 RepID=A0ABW5NKU1_9SPHI
MSSKYTLKVGLFGVGLDAYWDQFDGLKETLEGYLDIVHQRLDQFGSEVVNLGLIDTAEKAMDAGHAFRRADVDILFLYATTYALSATVLPIAQRAKVPVIILNLSPTSAIDYQYFNKLGNRKMMTGEWLKFCGSCPVPEIANVFKRCNIPFYEVTGVLDDNDSCWQEIQEWIAAAEVVHTMAHNRLGLMGHYYNGMLDIYTDKTKQLATFGGHMEVIEVDELSAIKRGVSGQQTRERVALFREKFDIDPSCIESELERAARTSVALDLLVERYNLGSLAYYYKGTGNVENEDTMSSVILGNSLLTANHVPVAGEYEIKNAQAMKIMDAFGAGGSFTEYYALDFDEDVVLMGHDGPGHIAIAQGKTKVKPLEVYHGKVGNGLSVEMAVAHGPVTLLSVVDRMDGSIALLVAEGDSVAGPILEIGNTNSRYRFSIGARKFVNDWNSHGPAHHCAIGVGHIVNKIEKLGKLLATEVIRVC